MNKVQLGLYFVNEIVDDKIKKYCPSPTCNVNICSCEIIITCILITLDISIYDNNYAYLTNYKYIIKVAYL